MCIYIAIKNIVYKLLKYAIHIAIKYVFIDTPSL